MVMNYKELGRAQQIGEWAKGVAIMDATAQALEKQGLLPKRFPPDVQTVGMSNREMERLADSIIGLKVWGWGRDIIKRAPTASKEPQTLSPVAIDARTMGIHDDYPTTKQIWERAKEFGDRVTAEEMLLIAIEVAKGNIQVEIGKPLIGIMEPVANSDGDLCTLGVGYDEGELRLSAHYALPDDEWDPESQFVVSSRK